MRKTSIVGESHSTEAYDNKKRMGLPQAKMAMKLQKAFERAYEFVAH